MVVPRRGVWLNHDHYGLDSRIRLGITTIHERGHLEGDGGGCESGKGTWGMCECECECSILFRVTLVSSLYLSSLDRIMRPSFSLLFLFHYYYTIITCARSLNDS